MSRLHKMPVFVGLIGFFVCAVLLEFSVDAGWVMQLVVPRPSDTILAFPEVQEDMDLFGNFFVTLAMTAAATFLALLIGVPGG